MSRKSPFLPLFLLFLLFAVPIIIAWYLVAGGQWPGAQVNRGYLFRPAVSLQQMPWKNLDGQSILWKNNDQKWVMMYVVPQACNAVCHDSLYKLHQVRIALNQDQDRFTRVLVFLPPVKSGEFQAIQQDPNAKDMQMLTLTPTALTAQLSAYSGKEKLITEGGVLILDPQQRAVLAYPAAVNPQDLLKDLQRLMRAFHLGQNKT